MELVMELQKFWCFLMLVRIDSEAGAHESYDKTLHTTVDVVDKRSNQIMKTYHVYHDESLKVSAQTDSPPHQCRADTATQNI